jgi:crossover junction endodeoxyribonuclease RuvC
VFGGREALVRVLGVDPGLTRCGLGVVDGRPGRAVLVDVGVATTAAGDPLGERLVALERVLEEWLDRHRPDAVAVERVFAQANVRTVMGTAQAGAVAITCAARRGLPVVLHTPSEVKAAVTGNGRADKAQVGAMVTRLLRLDAPPRPADAADALALAICSVWRAPVADRLARGVAAVTK